MYRALSEATEATYMSFNGGSMLKYQFYCNVAET